MRTQLPPSLTRRFDYCMFLGGSFGYFDDERNLAVLKHARASLKPGGVLAFDATTPQHAIRLAAQKRSSEEVVTPTFGSVLDVRDREWRPRTSSMRSRKRHVELSTNRVLLDVTYDIKVYAHEDLRKLLAEAGFVNTVCEPMRALGGGLMDGRHMIAARAER